MTPERTASASKRVVDELSAMRFGRHQFRDDAVAVHHQDALTRRPARRTYSLSLFLRTFRPTARMIDGSFG